MSSTSPRITLKKELSRDNINVSQAMRRRLLFGSALEADVGASLSKVSTRELQRRECLTIPHIQIFENVSFHEYH